MSEPIVTPAHSQCDLLTWKDPVKTAKVFVPIVLGLIVWKSVNLLNVVFHLAYIGLLVSAAAEYAGKLVTGQGFVTKYKGSTKSYASYVNNEILPHIANFNQDFEAQFQKVVYAHDIETTLKAAGLSYILYKLTSWFSFYTLVFAVVVIAFTAPAVYSKNKKEIDAALAHFSRVAKEKSSEYTKLAHEKAAPHIDTLVKKTGPVGSFISSKIPTRTAGSTVGTSSFDEPTSATTTGSSKFPEVPSSTPQSSTLEEVVAEAKSKAADTEAPTSL